MRKFILGLGLVLVVGAAQAASDFALRKIVEDIQTGRDNANQIRTLRVLTGIEVPAGSIDATDLAADSVAASEIAAGAVGTSEIATDGVEAAEIAAGAVGTSEIATDGVAADEIAASAVGTSEIADGGVANGDLADATLIDLSTNKVGALGELGTVANGDLADADLLLVATNKPVISKSGSAVVVAYASGTNAQVVAWTGGPLGAALYPVASYYADGITNALGGFAAAQCTAGNTTNVTLRGDAVDTTALIFVIGIGAH